MCGACAGYKKLQGLVQPLHLFMIDALLASPLDSALQCCYPTYLPNYRDKLVFTASYSELAIKCKAPKDMKIGS